LSPGADTAVVLCGGRGTHLQEHAAAIPKPLVEVGGRPIVWHVVSLYARHRVSSGCCC
jgi:glucose-1-phosphate cytidylyltransferase